MMTRVTVDIRTDSDFRSTEIVADLRNVAEILFFPMRCVGFWDSPTGGHICPELLRREECPHRGGSPEEDLARYQATVGRQLKGALEIAFPHADVYIYLG